MDEVIYRKMTLSDIDQVYEIECACFSQPWSRRSLRDEVIKNDIAHYFVAESEGMVVGYAGIWLTCGEAHMTNIAVREDHRRRGIATRLMLSIMSEAVRLGADRMTLEVREGNLRAQRVYAALDFGFAGIRKKYYSDNGENAFILWNESLAATLERFRN